MKVLVYIGLNERYEIIEQYLTLLKKSLDKASNLGYDVTNFFVYSNDLEKNYALYSGFKDAYYWKAPNKPLGAKLNSMLPLVHEANWDYFVQFGCDDIIHPDFWKVAFPFLKDNLSTQKFDLLGMRKLLIYDYSLDRMKLIGPTPLIYGAGRFIPRSHFITASRRKLVKCLTSNTAGDRRGIVKTIPATRFKSIQYEFYEDVIHFWPPEKSSAMDNASFGYMRHSQPTKHIWTQHILDEEIPLSYILDIKTDGNINKYDKINGVEIPTEEANEILSIFGFKKRDQ